MTRIFVVIVSLFYVIGSFAANPVINFTVAYKTVSFAGKTRKAISVNQQIPAPTLHFKEGDHVTINVINKLDEETAIHWHGILLPWQMDGVLGVTQHGIQPGGHFQYQFTLHQSGTYWYHAHAGLQEQQGLYGAFIIDPPKPSTYHYTKDYTIVLSDWSNTHPDQILSNLKKEGDYYSPNFPLQPSLAKFIQDYRKASVDERRQLIDDYKMMQQMRMSIYDLSDVAYDAFLLNGRPTFEPWTAQVKVGDVVRLRFIGAGGSTIFHVKIPGTTMQMVHVEGNDVKPYTLTDFTIAPGETYDVLVKITENKAYPIYAESIDTVGAVYGALITSPSQHIDYKKISPFPEPVPVTRSMMGMMMAKMISPPPPQDNHPDHASMAGMEMSSDMPMDHATPMNSSMKMDHAMPMKHSMDMSMPTEPSIIGDTLSPPDSTYQTSVGTKYENVKAAVKTNDPNKPIAGVIRMELFGYMKQYIWFINGVPEHNAKPIIFEPGKRYRLVFTNTSMMRHPMHIHGHWFILRKGDGAYDPLLHTIEVAPGATITADVDTDASGQWLFHCHLLYHMMSGMSRVFQYASLIEITRNEAKPQHIVKETAYINRPIVRVDEVRPIDPALVTHPMAHHAGLWMANFLDIGADFFNNAQRVTFNGLYGPDFNKLSLFMNDAEMSKGVVENADLDIFYWHLLDQFWAIKGGINYYYRPASHPYWQPGIGLEGLMPYFIDTNIRGYVYSGSTKLDAQLSRDTQITNNFFIRLGIRSILASKTITAAGIGSGLNQIRYIISPYYRLMPGLNLTAEFEREQAYGAFKRIQQTNNESTGENTYTLGLAMLF